MLATLLLALGIPCSAQIAVILAMTAGLPFAASVWFVVSILLVLFLVGWLAAKVLDPLTPERGDHVLAAFFCLAASAVAVVWSVVHGLPFFRQ